MLVRSVAEKERGMCMKYGHGGDVYTYPGMLDFSANINPFGPGKAVVEAAERGVRAMAHYPDSQCRELKRALAEKLQLPESMILPGNGAADLIFSLVQAKRPRRAVLTAPSFSEYAQALKAVDCGIRYYYLKEWEEFTLQEDYLELLTEEVDLIFLCSPDNPTGKVIRRKLLEQILGQCERHGICMVLDECFYEFLEQPEKATMQKFVEAHPNLFLLRAFTKMYAMPGLRLGYALCSDNVLMERIGQVRQPWSVSTAAQAAGVAALKEEARVQMTREYIAAQRRWMEQEFKKLGITYVPSDANYILFRSRSDLSARLLERGILIRDCANYEGLGPGYYRVAVRLQEENEKLVEALREICGSSHCARDARD